MAEATKLDLEDNSMKSIIEFHLNLTKLRLSELQGTKIRRERSINWIGSAWKWVAGSPDSTDWDNILRSQNEVIRNSNNQYLINKKLFNATQEAIKRVNSMIAHTNSINKSISMGNLEILMANKVLILKEQVSEITRAAQMAKTGTVNTNLLDQKEIDRIIMEEEVLPYQNVIEALEYDKPSVYSNGTLLLYVLSVPKVKPNKYRTLLARATSKDGKRVDLKYQRLLMNEEETYGIIGNCFSANNVSICEENALRKLQEDECTAKLLKGGDARCRFETSNIETVELLDENTIFLTNFEGTIQSENQSRTLKGTYLIQLSNETIRIGNFTFSSRMSRSLQALPSVLTNVTSDGINLNLEYIHGLSLENIKRLRELGKNFHISTTTEIALLLVLAISCSVIWWKISRKIKIPEVQQKTHRTQTVADDPEETPKGPIQH